MSKNIYDAIDYILDEKRKDRSYTDIKKELSEKGWTAAEISQAVSTADRTLLRELQSAKKPIWGSSNKLIGYILIIGGISFTLSTYLGIIDLGDSFIILYGPVLGGFAFLSKDASDRAKNSQFRRHRRMR